MKTGTVKWFNDQKGYGFIIQDDDAERRENEGKDLFVHQRHIVMEGFRTLAEGQKVSYDTQMVEGRLQAVNVVPVE